MWIINVLKFENVQCRCLTIQVVDSLVIISTLIFEVADKSWIVWVCSICKYRKCTKDWKELKTNCGGMRKDDTENAKRIQTWGYNQTSVLHCKAFYE